MINKVNIVYKLYTDVVRTQGNNASDLKAFDKDGKEVTLDFSAIDAEFAKQDYQNKRAYPTLEQQLDMQYWDQVNSTTKWKEAIAKVKSDNPKP